MTSQDFDLVYLVHSMFDDLDHPEIWEKLSRMPEQGERAVLEEFEQAILQVDVSQWQASRSLNLLVLYLMVRAALGDLEYATGQLTQLQSSHSQNLQVCGALFHLRGLADPGNPRYRLSDRFCANPFMRFEVLERSTHQCCASWLPLSCGNLETGDWRDVWNSPAARAVRESMLDGSFRYCNKLLCPRILGNQLPTRTDPLLGEQVLGFIREQTTEMPVGPTTLNLSYDRSCNLSCPSCRTEKFAADSAMRERFEELQERNILPMLKDAESVYITGSGDPFASKNFRSLMSSLSAAEYPKLKITLMTNGMLLTPAEWQKFGNLHGMIETIRISIDGASAASHEAIRRGSRWEVMLQNLQFIGERRRAGEFRSFVLCYVVQRENFREMGDAVDLAKRIGADQVFFDQMSNWGTYTEAEFFEKSVFLPNHPLYEEFLECLQDPRMDDPVAFKPAFDGLRRYARKPVAA